MRFTRHGFREMLIGSLALAIAAVGLGLAWWPLALVVLPLLVFLFAFFRDPERDIPQDQFAMVSPADGKVSDITQLPHHELLGGPCVRVGIFLSVFNVHINRSPCDGKVIDVRYKRGRFINALHHDQASEQNESNTLVLAEPTSGQPVAIVKQIVGLIARRIVCEKEVGDRCSRGERIGMIKFGSRTELYIPSRLEPTIVVAIGQSVRGAADVIARLGVPVHSVAHRVDCEEMEPLLHRETPA